MKLKSFIFGAIAVLAFVSCDRNTDGLVLDAPVLEISDTSSTSFTVAWNAVEGADMYTYEFMEDQASTEKLSVSFEDLKTDTLYTVKVKAVSTVAKAESEWSEISVELVSSGTSPDPEYVINLTAEMKPDMVLNVKTSPTDKEAPYYFEPVPGSIYEGFNDDPEAMFMDIINTYLAYYQYDSAMAFENLKMTGDEDKDYNISKYAEPEFFVFAAGIDEEMNITTAVESVKVSLDLPVSENKFVIVVDVCTQSEIRVTVAPTNGDQYALILQDKETVDALSDTQLKSLLLSLVNDNNLCVNETTMTYNKNIVPSHDYSILVFGYEEGVITTAINRKDIRTPDPVVVEDLTFEFEITPVGPREVDVEIRPSDEAASYFYDVVSLSDWAQYYQNEPSLYVEEMADSQGRDVLDYLDVFGSIGTETYTYGDFYLSPDSDYVLFAMGYYVEGDQVIWLEAQYEDFHTPADEGGEGPVENLTFELQIMGVEIGRFYVEVIPSDNNAPYVYAVMTDIEYDEYFPDDIYGYFYQQYENSGFEGTFAAYVESISKTGESYELSDYYQSDDCWYYKLIAAGVVVDGDNVTFYAPSEMYLWYETWW